MVNRTRVDGQSPLVCRIDVLAPEKRARHAALLADFESRLQGIPPERASPGAHLAKTD